MTEQHPPPVSIVAPPREVPVALKTVDDPGGGAGRHPECRGKCSRGHRFATAFGVHHMEKRLEVCRVEPFAGGEEVPDPLGGDTQALDQLDELFAQLCPLLGVMRAVHHPRAFRLAISISLSHSLTS